MKITSKEIRKYLKQYDSFFGHRPSKTAALLDPEYDVIPDNELMRWCERSAQCLVRFLRSKNNVKYKRLTASSLYRIYKPVASDCEDITGWSLSFFRMLWMLDGHKRNPAAFRVVINNEAGLHSIAWIKTEFCWRSVEFQNLTIIPNQRILSVI